MGDPEPMTPQDVLEMLVSEVLAASPAAARVFIERRMGCVGCTFSQFETVAEVAAVYGCDGFELARSLAAAKFQSDGSGNENKHTGHRTFALSHRTFAPRTVAPSDRTASLSYGCER
jgi:hybrid cluster-associated redox disulfide protein